MNTEKIDPTERMNSMTDGYGFDVVVVAGGVSGGTEIRRSPGIKGRTDYCHWNFSGRCFAASIGSCAEADIHEGLLRLGLETLRRSLSIF